jgi:hypothetical protein
MQYCEVSMSTEVTVHKVETTYAAGRSPKSWEFNDDAGIVWAGTGSFDTAQEAYNSIEYFDLQDHDWDVYKTVTTSTQTKVTPPYKEG